MTRPPDLDGCTIRVGYQPVMGTHLQLQITSASEAGARAAEATAVREATRLEAMFTLFDASSDLCRWRSGELAVPAPELAELLAAAAAWQERSGGAFNSLAGVLNERWLQAVADGRRPSTTDLAELTASIAEPRFAAADGTIVRLGDCGSVDLNAIAKGHVVDLVAQRVLADVDVTRLVVNAGGDLVHRGSGVLRVAVEDPHQAYDNAPPMTRIEISDAAVATSGRARRWFEIDGERHSRVLDPRTGEPVAHTASATVIAPDATTADVLATVCSVLEPTEAISLVSLLASDGQDLAALVVGADGSEHRSDGWIAFEAPAAS